jgi:hypothetical protein
MHKNAMKCNKTQNKWCINKHGASKIIDTFETYHAFIQKLKEVVRKEVIKLSEAGIIYPIADSKCFSHIRCFPKKGRNYYCPK